MIRNISIVVLLYLSAVATTAEGQRLPYRSLQYDIDSNYWGGYVPDADADNGDEYFKHIRIICNNTTPSYNNIPTYYCSRGIFSVGTKSSVNPQSVQTIDSASCGAALNGGRNLVTNGQYTEGHTLLKDYIESCAWQDNSFRAFNSLGVSNSWMDTNRYRHEVFREWLKKVLYYNTTQPWYYCADVGAIVSTFKWFNDERGYDANGKIAVWKYLIESNKCPEWTPLLPDDIAWERDLQRMTYRDTVQDSIATPLDTTLPTLEELGLELLRGQQSAVTETPRRNAIVSFTASSNPFKEETTLEVEVGDASLLHLEILDILGRTVYSEGLGMRQPGSYSFVIDGRQWSSGTYFARLTSYGGEVKTIKLIKE